MNDPDYGTISDVDPDLSGDPPYTTLQGWYEDTWDETEIQHARCHHGEAADLGELNTQTQTPVCTPTAEQPVCIYAADGSEQDGSADDENQGAAIITTGMGVACLLTTWDFVHVAGLRVAANGDGSAGIVIFHFYWSLPATPTGATIERCMVTQNRAAGGGTMGIFAQRNYVSGEVAIFNNLILNKDSTKDCGGMYLSTGDGSNVTATIEANSIANCAGINTAGIGCITMPGSQNDITTRNNVVAHDGSQGGDCFADWGGGTTNWDSDYDVSSDATAQGTNSKTNAAIADVWADPDSIGTPFTPKTGGELDPPDGTNLYSAGVTEDAIGAERPTQGAHYRGGVEIFAGLYKAYGGSAPSTVDYADMLASVRAGTASMDIAGLGLAAGGTYCLAVRATSAAGVEETNTDRLARAVVDEFGQLQQPPLAAVEELTAELQADGTVIVGFTHMTSPGWAAPTRFEVLSDNGTGELNLAAPVATIDVTDPDVGDYEVALDPPGLPVKYSARACSASAVGPPAPPVSVLSPAAPIAPQQM